MNDYAVKVEWYYLPVNEDIKTFVNHYYQIYMNIGNEIDESVSKDTFTKEK